MPTDIRRYTTSGGALCASRSFHLGAEPLAGSGFEDEAPEAEFSDCSEGAELRVASTMKWQVGIDGHSGFAEDQ